MRKEFTKIITGALSIGLILGMFPTQMYASEQISINQEEKEVSIKDATVLVSPDLRYTMGFNDGDYNYKILSQEDGTVEINTYVPSEQSDNKIHIPQQVEYDGETYTVTSIGSNAFFGHGELTGELVIPNTVTNIGDNAFRGCIGLIGDLIIPDSVVNIGELAFGECKGFNGKISIPNSVTNIGHSAFWECSGLIGDLVIPDSVTYVGSGVFMGCTSLNGKLVISNNLKEIRNNVFRDCSSLTGDLIIPDSVTAIGDYAFDQCGQLTGNLIIPDRVVSIGLTAFGHCEGLTGDLIIPHGVTSIGGSAFLSCKNLTSIVIPFNLSNIVDGSFAWCENVNKIALNYGEENITNQGYNEWKTFITDKMGLDEKKIESGYIFNTTETKQVKGPGIEIPDIEAPVFNYTGESTITLKNGSEFTLPKVTASDNKDESVAITCVIRDSSDEIIPAIDTKITGTYTITYSAADKAGNEATPLVITVVVKDEVASIQFKDDNFKQVLIESGVDKDNDGEITAEEMEQVVRLFILGKQINDISGLEYAINLERLNISENPISDLTPLSNLNKISTLEMQACKISTLESIKGLTNLRSLVVNDNMVEDLTPLKGLSGLTYLHLTSNRLVNIEPISQLPNIVRLDLRYNLIKDISSLVGKEYSELRLAYNYLDINNDSDTMRVIKQIEAAGGDVIYTPQKQPISSNANLSSLKTNQGSLSPAFNKETITYTMTVENEIKNIVIQGMVEDEAASIEGLGEKILNVGDNTIKIIVTAADKTTKTYTIIITRKAAINTEPSSGGGGGSSPKLPTIEEVLEKLQDKEVIISNFKEQMPYTSLNTVLTLEQIKKLTNNKLTDKQLQEIMDKPELLKKLGIESSMLSSQVILKPLEDPVFVDVPQSHWANNSIKLAAELGLVVGMPNGTFEPKASLQVADTFTFLDRVLLLNGITDMRLSRNTVEKYITNKDDWAFANIASIASKLSENTLQVINELGDRPIQRELLAQVLYEITEGKLETNRDEILFEDIEESSYKEAISYCVRVGLLNGMDNKYMKPDKELTRAELMSVLVRLNELLK